MNVFKKIIVYLFIFLKKIFHFSFFITTIFLFVSYYASYIQPQTFVLLPVICWLFPILLLLQLFWIMFFALSFQLKKLFLSIIILLFFFPEIKKFYNISFSSSYKQSSNTISIMSFNVKLFDLYNWQNNLSTRKKIFDYLQSHPADVICLQEFYTSEDSNDFDNLKALKAIFPNAYFHHEYFVTLRKNDHWGMLTISKYPIVKTSVVNFHNAKNNGCIYSDIVFNKDTIRVFNVHFQSYNFFKKRKWKMNQPPDNKGFYESLDTTYKSMNFFQKVYFNTVLRVQQSEVVLNLIKKTPYPVLIAGDFNDIANAYIIRQFNKNELSDAYVEKGNGLGITYHDKLHLRIDYIFHDLNFTPLDFYVDNSDFTATLSDHYPIRAIFNITQ